MVGGDVSHSRSLINVSQRLASSPPDSPAGINFCGVKLRDNQAWTGLTPEIGKRAGHSGGAVLYKYEKNSSS